MPLKWRKAGEGPRIRPISVAFDTGSVEKNNHRSNLIDPQHSNLRHIRHARSCWSWGRKRRLQYGRGCRGSSTPPDPPAGSERMSRNRRTDLDELAHKLRQQGLTFQVIADRLG